MSSINHKIYLFGGKDNEKEELNDLHEYDTETNTWA